MSEKRGHTKTNLSGKSLGKTSLAKQSKTKRGPAKRPSAKSTEKKPLPLVFRPRVAEDDSFIMQLTENQLGAVHEQSFGEPFPREQFLRYLQSGAPTVVVEQGDKKIGYYSYLTSHDGKMHVSAMVIDPEHQSDGIGTTVMKQLEQEAQTRGVHTLEVFVQESNPKSLAFTRKLGFVEVYRVTGDTICFQKTVAPQAQVAAPTGAQYQQPPYNFG